MNLVTTTSNAFANKVIIKANMLSARMKYWISSHISSKKIVTMKVNRMRKGILKFT